MKRIGIALMALVLMGVGQAMAAPPVVSNVQVTFPDDDGTANFPNGRIRITYDLADADGDNCFVFVRAQGDSNQTASYWDERLDSITGDFTSWDTSQPGLPTANVSPGSKEIIWDAPADYPNTEFLRMRFTILAFDGDMSRIQVQLKGGATMEMIYIEPGSFTDNGTAYTIERGFYISRTEVTKRQWLHAMGYDNNTASTLNNETGRRCDTHPWYNCNDNAGLRDSNWNNDLDSPATFLAPWDTDSNRRLGINKFLDKLNSENDGNEKISYGATAYENNTIPFLYYITYRMPTSQEWIHAAKAGTETKFYWGDNVISVNGYEWNYANTVSAGLNYDQVVGQKFSNPLGLFDMTGNVQEYVLDGSRGYSLMGLHYYNSSPAFNSAPYKLQAITYQDQTTTAVSRYTGFRVVRNAPW